MKYIMMCAAAIAISLGLGALLMQLIQKISSRHMPRGKNIISSFLLGILVMCLISLGYLSMYYHSDQKTIDQIIASSEVHMEKISGGFYFDGPGEETALVFYPGAKVDSYAYAPLMTRLAEQGMDCFLAEVPFHMAMFGSNRAGEFMSRYSYETWITGGHSMGGIIASGYAAKHPDQISAVVMLASYPTSQIPDGIQYCSIYGSNDMCLNHEAYEKARSLWPENFMEKCIEGGNHAQFGNYGIQKGDGSSDISTEEQQKITAEIICSYLLGDQHIIDIS